MLFVLTLLHAFTDSVINTCQSILADIAQLRASGALYYYLLGPVAALVGVIQDTLRDSTPGLLVTNLARLQELLMFMASTAPGDLSSYHQVIFVLYFVEAVFVSLFLVLLHPPFAERYLVLKLLSVVPTFVVIPTYIRFFFWIVGCLVLAVELAVVFAWFCRHNTRIVWARRTVLSGGPRYSPFKLRLGDRTIWRYSWCLAYGYSKIMLLCNDFHPILWFRGLVAFVRRAAQGSTDIVAGTTLRGFPKPPSAPTAADLSPDFGYITGLLEQDSVANLRYGVLFILALSSLGVYSIILAGWSSNSKYAFIGALRSAAQMISYEVAISLIILPVVILSGTLNLTMMTHIQSITSWFIWPLFPASLLFLVAMLAETNRTPFDLPEAEAELVAGYNVDYSSLPFAMFFLGEYCNMILISVLYCILFLGGGVCFIDSLSALYLSLKASTIWIFFVLVRATLPRYRYDQLMDIGWKVFLPVAGGFLVFGFGVLVFFDALPVTSELPVPNLERFDPAIHTTALEIYYSYRP